MKEAQQVQVEVGGFKNPQIEKGKALTIEVNGRRYALTHKSKWALLRANYTYKINAERKSYPKMNIDQFFMMKFKGMDDVRCDLQHIIQGDRIHAVATTKHSLTKPQHIYGMLSKVLKKQNLEFEERSYLQGRVVFLRKLQFAEVGIQVDGGDILTDRAIRIEGFARITSCFNPISFCGLHDLFAQHKPVKQRILRFEKKEKITQRFNKVLEDVKPELEKVVERLEKSQKQSVNLTQAEALLVGIGKPYGLGFKTIKKALTRFEFEEKQTIYGLAQAVSWQAENEEIFKKKDKVRQSLASTAGAIILIHNVKEVHKRAKKWVDESAEAKKVLFNLRNPKKEKVKAIARTRKR